MSPVPETILRALSLTDPSKASLSTSGLGSGFTSTATLRAKLPNNTTNTDEERQYFIKTSSDGKAAEEMFRGESESLNAIADSVPGFCPRALAWGPLEEGSKLHSTPAPVDPETGRRRFGFPVPTFCGDTKQPNHFRDSWADFYAEERLLRILATSEERNGKDEGLRDLVEKTAYGVVPRLLGDDHLGYNSQGEGDGILPVVIHGDLWSGNADRGRIVGSGRDDSPGDVVYDPSACYGHSEFELGIMHMFGGFGSRFFEQYHRIVPRTEPVEEYNDRVRLYELYHHLNHHAIFGGGYRSGAMSIMQKLVGKYGDGK
ncbi:hypothetical protein N7450_002506 [Penicillium hetheringtonii]|uniref:protein-ribulosamine 3-kinase n=1 Tax=Penicillium hetheringtonii TaxID=911720 RepID=A0AAD6GXD2_9EURO|nr:hypothetical protein N7450_002506 [Penicillium hetheringtonii]